MEDDGEVEGEGCERKREEAVVDDREGWIEEQRGW